MKSNQVLPALGVACGVFVLVATLAPRTQAATNASMSDKHFVSDALEGGMAEVQMGQLAEEKGSSNDVKKFGHKMVEDHTKLGDQMKQVAGQLGVSVPKSPSLMEQVEIKKLRGLSGNDFDQEYIKAMVKDHQDDLNAFQKEADSGTSSLVKDAASQGAEVISGHLNMIKEIAGAHNIALK